MRRTRVPPDGRREDASAAGRSAAVDRRRAPSRARGARCPRRGSGHHPPPTAPPRTTCCRRSAASPAPVSRSIRGNPTRGRASRLSVVPDHAGRCQKMAIAPTNSSACAKSGKAVTSISRATPSRPTIRITRCAGSRRFSAMPSGRSFERERRTVGSHRFERGRPLVGGHRDSFGVPLPEHVLGRLVEVDEAALRVHEEDRGRQARREIPGQDQHEVVLGGRHVGESSQ